MQESLAHNKINAFINSYARNKLVVYQGEIESIASVDVGKELSLLLGNVIEDIRLSMKAKLLVENLFNSSIQNHSDFGQILALKNIGILLEPELKIDFANLLDQASRTNPLFLQWEGEVQDNKLYFLSNEGIEIDIKNLSHIVL